MAVRWILRGLRSETDLNRDGSQATAKCVAAPNRLVRAAEEAASAISEGSAFQQDDLLSSARDDTQQTLKISSNA